MTLDTQTPIVWEEYEDRPTWALPSDAPCHAGLTHLALRRWWQQQGQEKQPEPIAYVRSGAGDYAAFADPPVVVYWPDHNHEYFEIYPWKEGNMPEMYLSSVTSNIAGGLCFDLARLTCLYGDSRSGKTMRVRGATLAAAGGAPDMQGRAWVQGKALERLCPPGETLSVIGVYATDNGAIPVTFEKAEGREAKHEGMNSTVMVYDEIKAALTGSPAKALEFLAPWMDVAEEDVLVLLPSSVRDAYREMVTTLPAALNAMQRLHAVVTVADQQMRAANAEVRSLERSMDLLDGGVAVSTADLARMKEEMEEAEMAMEAAIALNVTRSKEPEATAHMRERIKDLALRIEDLQHEKHMKEADLAKLQHAAEAAAKNHTQATRRRDEVTATVTKLEREFEEAQVEVTRLRAQAEKQKPQDSAIIDVWKNIKVFAQQHIDNNAARCGICSTPHEPRAFARALEVRIHTANRETAAFREQEIAYAQAVEQVREAEGTIRQLQGHIETAHKTLATLDVDGLSRAYEETQARIVRLQADLASIKEKGSTAYEKKVTLEGEVQGSDGAAHAATSTEWVGIDAQRLRVTELAAKIAEANAQRVNVQKRQEMVDSLDKQQARAATLKRLKGAAATAAKKASEVATTSLEERVNTYLPGALRFGFCADPVMWGLRRPSGEINEFLSGAETVIVLSAICFAYAASRPKSAVLIVPEERFVDGDLLATTMRRWSKVAPPNAQIIVTNGVKPKGRTPAGWLVEHVTRTPDDDESSASEDAAEGEE